VGRGASFAVFSAPILDLSHISALLEGAIVMICLSILADIIFEKALFDAKEIECDAVIVLAVLSTPVALVHMANID
jgi:hypothetical protein